MPAAQSSSGLQRLLDAEMARVPARAGVWVKHLTTGEEASVRADETFNSGHSKNTLVLTPLHHVAVVKGSPLPPMRSNQQFGH